MKNPLKRNKNENSSSQDGKVHFKKTKTTKRPKPKGNILPKYKKKGSSYNKNKLARKIDVKNYIKYSALIIASLMVASGAAMGAYRGTLWVIDTRASKEIKVIESGQVLGFSNVPTYPQSEYIFLPSEETESVQEFISTGRTIYRLDWNTDIEKVYDFYLEKLPQSGWDHVLSVDRTSNEAKYGEYFVDRERDIGLRIYDRVNDIWYEKITIADAETGLRAQLEKELERELIIASDKGTNLLPDFPWSLTVPKEYVTKYFATNEGDLRGVQFVKTGSDKEFILEPVAPYGAGYDDLFLEEYVKIINFRLSEGDESHRWDIINSQYLDIGGQIFLKGDVTSSKGAGVIYILNNTNNNFAYAFFQPHEESTFTQFVLRNISLKKGKLNVNDFNFSE